MLLDTSFVAHGALQAYVVYIHTVTLQPIWPMQCQLTSKLNVPSIFVIILGDYKPTAVYNFVRCRINDLPMSVASADSSIRVQEIAEID